MSGGVEKRIIPVLITGGIGSGKSVVSRVLRLRGYEVYDCDYEARFLMNGDAEILQSLRDRWGPEAVIDGETNRPFVATRVFGNPEELRWLNSRVHGAVKRDIAERLRRNPCMVVECAIPESSGITEMSRRVWLVTAPEELRLRRVMKRSRCSAAEVQSRMAAQQSEYATLPPERLALITNVDETALLPQIDKLLNQIEQQC